MWRDPWRVHGLRPGPSLMASAKKATLPDLGSPAPESSLPGARTERGSRGGQSAVWREPSPGRNPGEVTFRVGMRVGEHFQKKVPAHMSAASQTSGRETLGSRPDAEN